MNPPWRVDGHRMLDRIARLATETSASPGVTRLAYSDEDVAARDIVAAWMQEAGLEVELDAAANLIGRTTRAAAGEPTFMVGSHLDTVIGGGPLDGTYGVIAGIELAECLGGRAADLALAIVAFANEEGVIAPPGRAGSRAIAGDPPAPSLVVGPSGRTLGDLIACAGGRADALAGAAWPAGRITGYLELHIEQGPVLESSNHDIGVVEAITGRAVADIVVTGVSNHAGTTPMMARHDALTAAAELILGVQRLGADGSVRVATTGSITAKPNVVNVIAGNVEIIVDLRDPDHSRLAAAVNDLAELCTTTAATTGAQIRLHQRPLVTPTPMTQHFMAAIERTASALELSSTRLPSGAGHDAQSIAQLCPTGMIFVPSDGGVSHAPAEHTGDEHLIAGANVFVNTARHLAGHQLSASGASR